MNQQSRWIYILIGAVVLLLAFRFLFVFRFLFLMFLIAAAFGLGIYYIWYFRKKKQEESAFNESVEGRIQTQLEECRVLRRRNEEELKNIRSNIRDLEVSQASLDQLNESNRAETRKLLDGFYRELKLWETKEEFFRTAEHKLHNLLHNHRLEQQLDDKRQKLLELQEDKYEELAELEELRYNLVSDSAFLETIDELSQQMKLSSSYENASGLQEQLEEMTANLKRI